jgi:L-iditol 2-dehydrogenase
MGRTVDGGLAEYLAVGGEVLGAGCVVKIPDGVTLEGASLAVPLSGCLRAQEELGVGLASTVAIVGAGPLGCLHALLAGAAGARRVVMADADGGRLGRAGAVCGGDVTLVDTSKEDLAGEISALTERRGADVVIVTRPEAGCDGVVFEVVGRGGRVGFFETHGAREAPVGLDVGVLRSKQFSVLGMSGAAPRHLELALDVVASGHVDLSGLTGETVELAEAVGAIERMRSGELYKAIVRP